MSTYKLSPLIRRSRCSSAVAIPTFDHIAVDTADVPSRLPSYGDVSLSVAGPSPGPHHHGQLLRPRTACSTQDTGLHKDQEDSSTPDTGLNKDQEDSSTPDTGLHKDQEDSSTPDTGLNKDPESLTRSVSDVLSAIGDERLHRRRDRVTLMRVALQTKIYNFLERPTGWRCFLYHFCVYVYYVLVFPRSTLRLRLLFQAGSRGRQLKSQETRTCD